MVIYQCVTQVNRSVLCSLISCSAVLSSTGLLTTWCSLVCFCWLLLLAMLHVRWRVIHTLLFARVHPHTLPVTHAQLSHRCEKIMLRWSHPLTLTSYFNLLSTHTSTFHTSSHACTQTLLHNGHILGFKTHKLYYTHIAHNTNPLPHDSPFINMGKHKSSLLQADQADGQGLISVWQLLIGL